LIFVKATSRTVDLIILISRTLILNTEPTAFSEIIISKRMNVSNTIKLAVALMLVATVVVTRLNSSRDVSYE
jgi:hypothetical protein